MTNFVRGVRNVGLIQVSGKLPTYPFPKPTVCPKWKVSDNVDSGEGWVVSFRET